MRLDTPEMIWHGDGTKERITSIDFHPFFQTFVTGGSESIDSFKDTGIPIYIKEWEINFKEALKENSDEKQTSQIIPEIENDSSNSFSTPMKLHRYIKYIGGLEGGHNTTVNSIKFSPNGQYLASGADAAKKESGAMVIIWTRREKYTKFGSEEKEIGWGPHKVPLFGHVADITDLKWSNDSKYLLSGSVDNSAILWNIEKMVLLQRFDGHSHFVQGVAIDPHFKYLITQSSDRSVKIWKSNKSKQKISFYPFANLKKGFFKEQSENINNINSQQMEIEKIPSQSQQTNSFRLFLDETSVSSFFRRPDFSPDGSFFILPAAQYQTKPLEKPFSAVLLYRRNDCTNPCLVYSTNNKPAICVRFCPKILKLDPNLPQIFDLSYKMVFAVATVDSVIIYHTQSLVPLVIVGNIHFASLTDLAWCGTKSVGISSSDGYCSFIFMEEGEIGIELTEEEINQIDESLKEIMIKDNYYEKKKEEIKIEDDNKEKKKDEPIQEIKIVRNDANGGVKKIIKPVLLQSFNENKS